MRELVMMIDHLFAIETFRIVVSLTIGIAVLFGALLGYSARWAQEKRSQAIREFKRNKIEL